MDFGSFSSLKPSNPAFNSSIFCLIRISKAPQKSCCFAMSSRMVFLTLHISDISGHLAYLLVKDGDLVLVCSVVLDQSGESLWMSSRACSCSLSFARSSLIFYIPLSELFFEFVSLPRLILGQPFSVLNHLCVVLHTKFSPTIFA